MRVYFHDLSSSKVSVAQELSIFRDSFLSALTQIAGLNVTATLVNMTVLSTSSGIVAVDLVFTEQLAVDVVSRQIDNMLVSFEGSNYSASSYDVAPPPASTQSPPSHSPMSDHALAVGFAGGAGVFCLFVLLALVSVKKRHKVILPVTADTMAMV